MPTRRRQHTYWSIYVGRGNEDAAARWLADCSMMAIFFWWLCMYILYVSNAADEGEMFPSTEFALLDCESFVCNLICDMEEIVSA